MAELPDSGQEHGMSVEIDAKVENIKHRLIGAVLWNGAQLHKTP
jgi:hypothetical protein